MSISGLRIDEQRPLRGLPASPFENPRVETVEIVVRPSPAETGDWSEPFGRFAKYRLHESSPATSQIVIAKSACCAARVALREAQVGRHHEEPDIPCAAIAERLRDPRLVAAGHVAHADDERRHLVPRAAAIVYASPATDRAVRRARGVVVVGRDAILRIGDDEIPVDRRALSAGVRATSARNTRAIARTNFTNSAAVNDVGDGIHVGGSGNPLPPAAGAFARSIAR